jgi:hypothetical protein
MQTNLPDTTGHVFNGVTFKFLQDKVRSALSKCHQDDVKKDLVEIARLVALGNEELTALTSKASPLPWKLGEGYEQDFPGLYLTDNNGVVIHSEDVILSRDNLELILAAVNNLSEDTCQNS